MLFKKRIDDRIYNAISNDDINTVKPLINKDLKLLNAKDSNGVTPLHRAISYCQLDIINYLILKGANIHIKDNLGATALHLACIGGNNEIIQLLIDKGANIFAKDKRKATPLHYSAGGLFENVKLLISKEGEVNARAKNGGTPLHFCICNCKKDAILIIDLLINKGADVNAKDYNSLSSLHYAAMLPHPTPDDPLAAADKITALIANGANINIKDKKGRTPLKLALKGDHRESVKLIKEHGGIE